MHTNCTYFAHDAVSQSALKKIIFSPPNNSLSAVFLVCFNFQCMSMWLKMVKMFSECQTAWTRVSRRVIRRLTRIKAICIWYFGLRVNHCLNDKKTIGFYRPSGAYICLAIIKTSTKLNNFASRSW